MPAKTMAKMESRAARPNCRRQSDVYCCETRLASIVKQLTLSRESLYLAIHAIMLTFRQWAASIARTCRTTRCLISIHSVPPKCGSQAKGILVKVELGIYEVLNAQYIPGFWIAKQLTCTRICYCQDYQPVMSKSQAA